LWRADPGAQATSSQLDEPDGVAVSPSGYVYISDAGNNMVEEVAPDGELSVVAGTGTAGLPTNGPATASDLDNPAGISLDGAGDLYIADADNNLVEEVTPDGQLTVVAGTGTADSPTSGPATSSDLNDPTDVVPDNEGGFYIADTGNNVVEHVSSEQDLSVVAGTGSLGTFVPGPATSSELSEPKGLALDPDGDLFISDYDGSSLCVFGREEPALRPRESGLGRVALGGLRPDVTCGTPPDDIVVELSDGDLS